MSHKKLVDLRKTFVDNSNCHMRFIMDKVKKVSKLMKIIFKSLVWAIPICVIVYWSFVEVFIELGFSRFVLYYDKLMINSLTKSLAILVAVIPVSVFIFILVRLVKLFDNYENGVIFAVQNAIIYKQLGVSLIILALVDAIYSSLLSTVVSFQSPKTFLIVDFGINEIIYILAGVVIYLISLIMLEGYEINNELENTV